MRPSELSFKLPDYQRYDVEPPERILANPDRCEGELMDEDEIYDYCRDSLGVLRVLEDRNPERRQELMQMFLTDCRFLLKIGRIDQEDFEALMAEAGAPQS